MRYSCFFADTFSNGSLHLMQFFAMAGLMALHFEHFLGFATVVGLKHMRHFSSFICVNSLNGRSPP